VFGTLANPNEIANIPGTTIYTANGWGVYLYSSQIPLSGGSFSVEFNNTALNDGVFNAEADLAGEAMMPPNMFNILIAVGVPVSEGQGYAGVISNVQINDYRNVLDTIKTVNDYVQIPYSYNPLNVNYVQSTSTSATTPCHTIAQCYADEDLIQNGFALNLAGSSMGGAASSFWAVATAALWLAGGAGLIGVTVYTLRGRRHGYHYWFWHSSSSGNSELAAASCNWQIEMGSSTVEFDPWGSQS
jgi:hypothetical protein